MKESELIAAAEELLRGGATNDDGYVTKSDLMAKGYTGYAIDNMLAQLERAGLLDTARVKRRTRAGYTAHFPGYRLTAEN